MPIVIAIAKYGFLIILMLNVNPKSFTPTFVNMIIIINYLHSFPSPPTTLSFCLVKRREKTHTIHINGLLLNYQKKKFQYLINSEKTNAMGSLQ